MLGHCTPMFIAALFAIAKIQTHPSLNKQIKKMGYIYTMSITLTLKKKEWNCAICSMNRLGAYHAKWNKSDRERQILYDIT